MHVCDENPHTYAAVHCYYHALITFLAVLLLFLSMVQSFYWYRIFAGIEYLFTLHGINEEISRFKRTY